MIGPATDSNRMFRNSFSFNGSWNCPVARQAHNLEVIGSNPSPRNHKKAQFPTRNLGFSLSKIISKSHVNLSSGKLRLSSTG